MKTYEFETFIKENNLDPQLEFPALLQKQITLFHQFKEQREYVNDEEKKRLDILLDKRAESILRAIENELEERLANNELLDDEPLYMLEEYQDTNTKDELLIEQLLKAGKKRIKRSYLQSKGFATTLQDKIVRVGHYFLVKSPMTYTYTIISKTELVTLLNHYMSNPKMLNKILTYRPHASS